MREKCSKRFFEKNSRFAHFGQKLSIIGHFGPKCPNMEGFRIFNFQNLPFGWMCAEVSFKGWKSLKVGGFETDFKQVPFLLWQTTHTYSESCGPVEKFFIFF